MPRQCVIVAAISTLILIVLIVACGNDNPECPNAVPTGSFTVSPQTGTIDTVFHFDASGSSDAEDAVSDLQVRWDWEDDGNWTDWSTTKTASHQYGAAGTKAIKLEVKDTGGLVDDTTMTIAVTSQPSVTVTVPNGGENWAVGSADTIRWTWTGSVGSVQIEYSANGGSTWSIVVATTANSGFYPWSVPSSPSAACRVKVSSVSAPSISDMSDADFTISPEVKDALLQEFAMSFSELNIGLYAQCLDDSYTFTFAASDWDIAGVTPARPYWGKTEDVDRMAHMFGSPATRGIEMDWQDPVADWEACTDSIFVAGPDVWQAVSCMCAVYQPDIRVTFGGGGEGEDLMYWVRDSQFLVTVCPDRYNEDLWTILRITERTSSWALQAERTTFGSLKAMFR